MPVEAIVVDTTIVAKGARKTSWGNVMIVGRDTGGSAADDTVVELTNLADVATQFGSTTDIYYAAREAFENKVDKVWCVRIAVTDVVDESITEGSVQILASFPVLGRPIPDVDEGADVLQYTYTTPTDPGAGKAELNTNTGEIWISGASTSLVDYSHVGNAAAWIANVEDMLKDYDIDVLIAANAPLGGLFFGENTQWTTFCDNNDWIIAMQTDPTVTLPATLVTDASQFTSRNIVAIAHQDTVYDIGSAVGALLSVIEPWKKLMWKTVPGIAPGAWFTKSEVETDLEGGATPVNAIIEKSGYNVCSDGLTTGAGNYKYIDITRVQYYLEDTIVNALTDLIRNTEVPYTSQGLQTVRSTIERACESAVQVGALREPFINTDTGLVQNGYDVEVPVIGDISSTDRENRDLTDVFVTVWLRGHIQQITLNLAIQL